MSAPNIHTVHLYSDSNDLIVHLSGIVASSLLVGSSVVIVATAAHREQLIEELLGVGIDLPRYAQERLFSMLDAKETLASFMVQDLPDPSRFRRSVGQVLANARACTRSKSGTFSVFGEMVALLWEAGNQTAALSLEGLWNDILTEIPFRLHCGYPKRAFRHETEVSAVCKVHSSVLRSGAWNPQSSSLPASL